MKSMKMYKEVYFLNFHKIKYAHNAGNILIHKHPLITEHVMLLSS